MTRAKAVRLMAGMLATMFGERKARVGQDVTNDKLSITTAQGTGLPDSLSIPSGVVWMIDSYTHYEFRLKDGRTITITPEDIWKALNDK